MASAVSGMRTASMAARAGRDFMRRASERGAAMFSDASMDKAVGKVTVVGTAHNVWGLG